MTHEWVREKGNGLALGAEWVPGSLVDNSSLHPRMNWQQVPHSVHKAATVGRAAEAPVDAGLQTGATNGRGFMGRDHRSRL